MVSNGAGPKRIKKNENEKKKMKMKIEWKTTVVFSHK